MAPIFARLAARLVDSGTGLLVKVLRDRAPGAADVVERLAGALGTAATEDSLMEVATSQPEVFDEAAKALETAQEERWKLAIATQAELLKREDERESWFSWAWRPAMSWLLIVLWAWGLLVQPLVVAIAGVGLEPLPIDKLVAFSGIWLAIYGGGHTIKSVFGKG